MTGVGDDAAVLCQPNGAFQVISTDHLRGFIADPGLMTRIAAVHALGDVWAMGAQPQVGLVSIVLPQMSADLQRRTLLEITQVATEVLSAAGAQLVGGHTTMGAEFTIGFTLTGTKNSIPLKCVSRTRERFLSRASRNLAPLLSRLITISLTKAVRIILFSN